MAQISSVSGLAAPATVAQIELSDPVTVTHISVADFGPDSNSRPDGEFWPDGEYSIAPALVLVTHHVEEIPPGFSHCMLLSEGQVVAAGLLSDVLTGDNLSAAFGQSIAVDVIEGRYFARRIRNRAAHRRRL